MKNLICKHYVVDNICVTCGSVIAYLQINRSGQPNTPITNGQPAPSEQSESRPTGHNAHPIEECSTCKDFQSSAKNIPGDWEKDLAEELSDFYSGDFKRVKAFISSLLKEREEKARKEEREDLVKEMERQASYLLDCGEDFDLNDALKILGKELQ